MQRVGWGQPLFCEPLLVYVCFMMTMFNLKCVGIIKVNETLQIVVSQFDSI